MPKSAKKRVKKVFESKAINVSCKVENTEIFRLV